MSSQDILGLVSRVSLHMFHQAGIHEFHFFPFKQFLHHGSIGGLSRLLFLWAILTLCLSTDYQRVENIKPCVSQT